MNNAFGQPQSIVAIGGTSDIALEVLTLITSRCRNLVLAGRDDGALSMLKSSLAAATGAEVATVHFDAREPDRASITVKECFDAAGGDVDVVVVAVGELGHQESDEREPPRVAQIIRVNFEWPAAALSAIAHRLRDQGHGAIIVLSSVAGVRVRRSNFLYGSAKAGLDSFCQGLRESLRDTGVSVHIVRAGFVRTKMTRGMVDPPLALDTAVAARFIVRGFERGDEVVWVPPRLQWIMAGMRILSSPAWRYLTRLEMLSQKDAASHRASD